MPIDLWLPAQERLGAADVGAAHFWIVLRQRLELDLASASGKGQDLLREVQNAHLLGIAYTVGPFRLSYRGYGELAVALGFGPVILLGTLYVLSHAAKIATPWAAGVLAALPISVFVLLVLWINQFQDAGADSASGKRTWVVRLAEKSADLDFTLPFRVYVVLNVMGFGFVAVIATLGFFAPTVGTPYAALALLAVPLFVRAQKLGSTWVKQWASRTDSPDERRRLFFSLLPVNALTISIHAATGLLLAVGYIISGCTAL